MDSHLQLLPVELPWGRSQINLCNAKIWWKLGRNLILNCLRILTPYIHQTSSIRTQITSLKALIKKDLYQEVLPQINSKSKLKKINMVNLQFSQMKFKINSKKIKSLWKIVKKYLRTIKKHRKWLVKLKMEYNRLGFKFSNP